MRVLIIDDEENIRRTTSALLEGMDHEVVAVGDAASALKQLDHSRFDVAFLDLKLGDQNGLDLLPDLLKNTEHLDVIAFTAFASFETAVEAMRRGAADYIPKPFTPEQIRQALARVTLSSNPAASRRTMSARRLKVLRLSTPPSSDPAMKSGDCNSQA